MQDNMILHLITELLVLRSKLDNDPVLQHFVNFYDLELDL